LGPCTPGGGESTCRQEGGERCKRKTTGEGVESKPGTVGLHVGVGGPERQRPIGWARSEEGGKREADLKKSNWEGQSTVSEDVAAGKKKKKKPPNYPPGERDSPLHKAILHVRAMIHANTEMHLKGRNDFIISGKEIAQRGNEKSTKNSWKWGRSYSMSQMWNVNHNEPEASKRSGAKKKTTIADRGVGCGGG